MSDECPGRAVRPAYPRFAALQAQVRAARGALQAREATRQRASSARAAHYTAFTAVTSGRRFGRAGRSDLFSRRGYELTVTYDYIAARIVSNVTSNDREVRGHLRVFELTITPL